MMQKRSFHISHVFRLAFVVLICLCNSSAVHGAEAESTPSPQPQPKEQVVVYYFHGTYRCPSCTTIEQYTRETIQHEFAPDLQAGRLAFLAINVEEPENAHFIQDYKLFTKSVIVSQVSAGKEQHWQNLGKVWELLQNEQAFKAYVQQEVTAALTPQEQKK